MSDQGWENQGSENNFINNEGHVDNQAMYQTINGGAHFHRNEPDLLSLLPVAAEAPFNSVDKTHLSYCLPDTRVQVLDEIYGWADQTTDPRIFWLNGMAGTGKSTLSRTIARKLHLDKRLAASFFFSRNREDVGHMRKFFTTVARQLARIDRFRDLVIEAIKDDRGITDKTLRDQWEQLIVGPLMKAQTSPTAKPVVLVVDALDECEGEKDVRLLLGLLRESADSKIPMRIFITSRPEMPIPPHFRIMPKVLHYDLALHEISRATVDRDIELFLQHQFESMRGDLDCLDEDWPGQEAIRALVRLSEGLFIYAATVCRYIEHHQNWSPQKLLDRFISADHLHDSEYEHPKVPSTSPTFELDKIYTEILLGCIMKEESERDRKAIAREIRILVGSIVLLEEPLPAASLGALLNFETFTIQRRLDQLRSVLNVPEDPSLPIRVLHSSFRDFVLDKSRCNTLFWVDEKLGHQYLSQNCLRLLLSPKSPLKRDILQLGHPGTSISQVNISLVLKSISTERRYACLFWVSHLERSGASFEREKQVEDFLSKHLFHWLELLSLLRQVNVAIRAFVSLERIVNLQCHSGSPGAAAKGSELTTQSTLREFIADAKKLILFNRYIIEEAPLQLYHSVLVFAPWNSIIRRCFKEELPKWIKKLPKVDKEWNSVISALECNDAGVDRVRFSADGKAIAAISRYQGRVLVWDIETGALLQKLDTINTDFQLDGGEGSFECWGVDISQDFQLVATVVADSWEGDHQTPSIVIRSVESETIVSTFQGEGKHCRYAFSCDGKYLMSLSSYSEAKLWDISSGALLFSKDLDHLAAHTDCSFSADGRILAALERGNGYQSIIVRSTLAPNDHPLTLQCSPEYLEELNTSPDGRLLASCHSNGVLQVWDLSNGGLIYTVDPHNFGIADDETWDDETWDIQFSPDSRLLMLASPSGHMVLIVDSRKGTALRKLLGVQWAPKMAAFSPDCKFFAMALHGGSIATWDLKSGRIINRYASDNPHLSSISFSPDGKLLALVWEYPHNDVVKLWETTAAEPLSHSNVDREQASYLFDNGRAICLDAEMETTVSAAFQFKENFRKKISLSQDCNIFAIARNVTPHQSPWMFIFEAATGKLVRKLLLSRYEYFSGPITLSPDGTLMAAALNSFIVRLWDIKSGTKLGEIPLPAYGIHIHKFDITFAPNNKWLALIPPSRNCLHIWGTFANKLMPKHIVQARARLLKLVAFSPNSELVAYASNQRLYLLNVETGRHLKTTTARTQDIHTFTFSPDSTKLAIICHNYTVEIWDIETRKTVSILRSCLFQTIGTQYQYLQPSLSKILVRDNWIMNGETRLLWLPSDYRPSEVAFQGNELLLKCSSGRVVAIEFDVPTEDCKILVK